MTSIDRIQVNWRQRFWSNTGSGYVYLVVRLVVGLLMFRLLYSAFSPGDFGFWLVLWSVLGFGILVDFGFGTTVQRATAQHLAGEVDGPRLNRLVATAFSLFVVLGCLFFFVAMLMRETVLTHMDLPVVDAERYRVAYRDFFMGMIPFLPLGLLPEVLRGLHRGAIINWLSAINSLVVYGCAHAALTAGWGLVDMIRLVVVLQQVPNLIALLFVRRAIPGFSLAPQWWSLRALLEQVNFSLSSYAIACSNALLAALDSLLVTGICGLLAVPAYVAGAKAADLLNQTVRQLYGALPAAVAEMHARGDRVQVGRLVMMGYRLTWVLATPLYVLALLYIEPLLRVLTGTVEVSPSSRVVGILLLTGSWLGAVVGGCGRRLLLLCGYHRAMMLISLMHLIAALVLGALLGWNFGPWGIALGILSAGFLVGSLPVVPLVLREMNVGLRDLARIVFLDLATFGVVFALPTVICFVAWPADATTGLFGLIGRGLVSLMPMAICIRRLRAMVG